MSAAGYILAINMLVAGLFAGVFAWISLHETARVPARWFVLSFALGMANFAVEWMVAAIANPRFVVFSAFSISLIALVIFTVGISRRYGARVPWRLLALAVGCSMLLNLAIYDMPRQSFLRVLLYQLPYFAVQAYAASIVLRAGRRGVLDTVLGWLLAISALHFLSKPFLAVAFGPGARPQDYVNSIYALISQSMGSVLLVAAGLLVAVILLRDVLAEVTEKSETDPLSGLLNRRGFEARAQLVSGLVSDTGAPASLILCDLDHFKTVNDRYGHMAGDQVIAAFGASLKAGAGDRHVAGRIGGEEFAILLPGANVVAARLFAEGLRGKLAALTFDGLPDDVRLTGSFGVAEMFAGDSLAHVLRRADRALYAAKNEGRDRVRVAPPELVGQPAERREWRGAR